MVVDENKNSVAKYSRQVLQLAAPINKRGFMSAISRPVINSATVHENDHDDPDDRSDNLEGLAVLNVSETKTDRQSSEHR